jgi:hypothetical protein
MSPARHPGARPFPGGLIPAVPCPLRASNQAISEFEFHISPTRSSSRPHVAAGTCGTSSSNRCARAIATDQLRARDSFRHVGNDAHVPPPYLVPERCESA